MCFNQGEGSHWSNEQSRDSEEQSDSLDADQLEKLGYEMSGEYKSVLSRQYRIKDVSLVSLILKGRVIKR